jgi:hypothetical protein
VFCIRLSFHSWAKIYFIGQDPNPEADPDISKVGSGQKIIRIRNTGRKVAALLLPVPAMLLLAQVKIVLLSVPVPVFWCRSQQKK